MCLIVAPGEDGTSAKLDRDVFDHVYKSNDDGFGAMWCEDNQVKHFKGLSATADVQFELMNKMADEHPGIVFHFRYKTHGKVIPGLAHPFRILHRSRHGYDMFFMHNGILSSFGNNLGYGQSDTTVFKDKILIPLLTRNPDALDDPETWAAIEKLTNGSRLIFMRSDGKVWRTAKTSWNNRYGVTLSNTYMLPREAYVPAPYYGAANNNNVSKLPNRDTHPLARWIQDSRGGRSLSWCKEVSPGFVRTEGGALYYDRGAGTNLSSKDYILRKEELHVLCGDMAEKDKEADKKTEVFLGEVVDETEDFDDDDLPFEEDSDVPPASSSPAPVQERLRYARIVYNCHNNVVADTTQLISDLICMGTDELRSFVKDDPSTAAEVLSEVVDMFLEHNTLLLKEPSGNGIAIDTDEMLDRGDSANHQLAMRAIGDKRKENYDALLKAAELVSGKTVVEEEKKVA